MQREFIKIADYAIWYLVPDTTSTFIHPNTGVPVRAHGPFKTQAEAEAHVPKPVRATFRLAA